MTEKFVMNEKWLNVGLTCAKWPILVMNFVSLTYWQHLMICRFPRGKFAGNPICQRDICCMDVLLML